MKFFHQQGFQLIDDISVSSRLSPTTIMDPSMSGAVVIDFKYEEVFLVIFILFLWGLVLRIFFQRWGVYSIYLSTFDILIQK